jgi:hypothetical protein
MPVMLLDEIAKEENTFAMTDDFIDEHGNAFTPNSGSIDWGLYDKDGEVLASAPSAPTSAESIDIVISGSSMTIQKHERKLASAPRFLRVSALYDSALGSGLKVVSEYKFFLENLKGIS